MASFGAVYDACVLYPAPLRDLLMHLALTDLYRAHWTAMIHDEWMRSLLEQRKDLTPETLERTRTLMDENVRDAVVTGFEPLIESLTLPDPDDRHVLAAAIRAGADVIVTFNLKDFPEERLAPFGIAAQHPDEFIDHLLDLAPGAVAAAAKRHRESLKREPKSVDEYLEAIARCGLPQTVSRLRAMAELL